MTDRGADTDKTPVPCNQINIFVGLGLLSTPYAYRAGGYIAGVALLLLSSLFCLSGHLIVAAFQYLPVDAPRSFPQLGEGIM